MSTLKFSPILDHPDLVSPSVLQLAQSLPEGDRPSVAEIEPQFMGGKELCAEYGLDLSMAANCVIVESKRGEIKTLCAIVMPVGTRADLNGSLKKRLQVKKISLAPLDKVLEDTGMEYGSITPFGLPLSWPIYIEESLLKQPELILGGGKQTSKILLSTQVLRSLPNVEIMEGLSLPK